MVMKHVSHFQTAVHLISSYKGQEPFAHFLKNFFREQKKFGSNDRKTISNLCYTCFRTGYALKDIALEERMLTGLFLCANTANDLLNHFKPEWNRQVECSLEEKLSMIPHSLNIADIFPWSDELSKGIDQEKFCRSFLSQPDLFLRIRPGNEETVYRKLSESHTRFRKMNDSCLALNNATRIDHILEIDREVVIQDYSSQRIGDLFRGTKSHSPLSVWDCCAASGGKSIMLFDLDHDLDITVSDIRKSILVNLKKRFEQAGIRKYRSLQADLSSSDYRPQIGKYDVVIADLPCTGSGTWSRTPESLAFFNQSKIDGYSQLQKRIVSNIIPSVKKGGRMVYITCSVFKKENEEVVDFIQKQYEVQLVEQEMATGYELKADSMFFAVFTI
jgi:16S rRNA (cytosine967-C5)-methyltransferase